MDPVTPAPVTSTAEAVELTPRAISPAAEPVETTAQPTIQARVNAMSPEERTKFRLMTPEERIAWRDNKPDADPDDEEADEAPAAVSTSPTAPVSKTISKRQERINEQIRAGIEAATRAQRDEIASLRAQMPQRQPAPRQEPAQRAPQTMQDVIERPLITPKPMSLGEFAQQFPDSQIDDFIDYRESYRAASREARSQHFQQAEVAQRDFHAKATSFVERATAARAKYPDFDQRTAALAARMVPHSGDPIADRVFRSPVSGDLFYLLATQPQVLSQLIASVRHLHPAEQREEVFAQIGKLEARFEASAPGRAVHNPTQTQAPNPPVTLGTRATSPVDEQTAALGRKDFSAYKRASNAAALAGRR